MAAQWMAVALRLVGRDPCRHGWGGFPRRRRGVWPRPAPFLGAGLVTFLAAIAVGVGLATRTLPAQLRWRTRLVAFAAGVLAGVVTFAATALLPVGDLVDQLQQGAVVADQDHDLGQAVTASYRHPRATRSRLLVGSSSSNTSGSRRSWRFAA
jgi:hypothetical protein